VWLLQRFLYKPVQAVIARRKALAEQAFAEARAAKAEAEAEHRRYEAGRTGLIEERQAVLKKLHDELEEERAGIIEKARAEAAEMIDNTRASLKKERSAAVAEARGNIADLAADMATTLLRKIDAASPGLNHGFLDHLEGELAKLPDEERMRLQQDLATPNARLTVVTAVALSADDQTHWRQRLAACLGPLDNVGAIGFEVDPAIVGGAELRFPHAVLTFTWADLLTQAKNALLADDPAR
jgi:F-type H+-transporting ATPase subunit b